MPAGQQQRRAGAEEQAGDKLSALEAWLESVGITWDRRLVRLAGAAAGCSGLALGVRAAAAVAEGAALCTIPKAACLSTRTSPIADILEKESLATTGLGLTLAVLHELSLGPESEW